MSTSDLFRLKKSQTAGVCAAMRCQAPGFELPGDLWGVPTVCLCDRHTAMAVAYSEANPDHVVEVVAEPMDAKQVEALAVAEAADLGAKAVGLSQLATVGTWLTRVYEVLSQMEAQHQEGAEVEKEAKAMEVETHDQMVVVNTLLRQDVIPRAAALEALEKEITQPLATALARIKELTKPAKTVWANVETLLRTHLITAKLLEDTRNTQAVKDAAAAEARGEDASEALSKITTTNDLDGTSMKIVWTAKVVDVLKMPLEYVTRIPNNKKLKEHCDKVAENHEPEPIEGVVFEREVRQRVTSVKN